MQTTSRFNLINQSLITKLIAFKFNFDVIKGTRIGLNNYVENVGYSLNQLMR